MEDKIENKNLNSEEHLKIGIYHLLNAALAFSEAGFNITGNSIGVFANNALKELEDKNNPDKLDPDKLSSEEYDNILSDIFNG